MMYAKFQINISKTERQERVYTNRWTDWHGYFDSAHHADHLVYIYFIGSTTFPSGCCSVVDIDKDIKIDNLQCKGK